MKLSGECKVVAKQRNTALPSTTKWFDQLLSGLESAHAAAVVYCREPKPLTVYGHTALSPSVH